MRLPHTGLLIAVFLLSLVGWALYYLPAQVVVSRVPTLQLAGSTLTVNASGGRAWQGQARWHWQHFVGDVSWQLDWHGLTPGVDITLTGPNGLRVQGWLTSNGGEFRADQLQLALPLSVVLAGQPQLAATGSVQGRIQQFHWHNGIKALQGKLYYTGGSGHWRNQAAVLPVMNAKLAMQQDTAVVLVTDSHQGVLAKASLDANNRGEVKVYRRYAEAVGLASGSGSSNAVIFKMSRSFGGGSNG